MRSEREAFSTSYGKQLEWVLANASHLLTREELDKYQHDWDRFAASLAWLETIDSDRVRDVLELGYKDASTKLISTYFPHWAISNYSEDLRSNSYSIASGSFDLVISMEVIEHLADVENGYNATFLFSGLAHNLLECRRILRDNGTMFITTPNACSYITLHQLLSGCPPMLWDRHVREYTCEELMRFFSDSGLVASRHEHVEVQCVDWDFSAYAHFLSSIGSRVDNRSSHMFFVLTKSR